MLIDYHLHNRFSPDSESETADIAKRAMERGIKEIALTNHVETFPPGGGRGDFHFDEACSRFSEIKKDIEATQSGFPELPIRFGAELEYIKEWMPEMKRFVDAMDFDFLIGSLHVVEGTVISSTKKELAEPFYGNVAEEYAYARYFDLLLKLVEWGEFDVIGHFDICKKSGYGFYGAFRPEQYKEPIRAVLKRMKEKGIGLELNTSGMDKGCKELFPHPQILKWAVEMGIENFTIGSDAHEIHETGRHLDKAITIAKEAGITHLSTFKTRHPTQYKI